MIKLSRSRLFTYLRPFVFLLPLILTALAPSSVQAQEIGIKVLNESYSYTFAKEAEFEIEIEENLREAILFYKVEGEIGQHFQRAQISGGSAKATIHLTSGQIPPAAQVTYFWYLEDTRGQILCAGEQSFRYLDQRFVWENKTRGNVIVFWYGKEGTGDQALDQAELSLLEIKNQLGFIQSQPVRIVAYQGWLDMKPAVANWGEGVMNLGNTMGTQTAVLFLHPGWGTTLTHELAHVLTSQLMEGSYNYLPFWLSEGLATYAVGQRGTVENPLSIALLSSGPTKSEDINPSYRQARSLVTFLIKERSGKEKILELLTVIAQGETVDNALLGVYGFDHNGLEKEWRSWLEKPFDRAPEPKAQPQTWLTHFAPVFGFAAALCFVLLIILIFALRKQR